MLQSYLNLCHEALDGLPLASLPIIIIIKKLPGILLCHCWQHSHHSPAGKVPWINSQIKTTGAVQQAGMCSVLLETATQTLQITRTARGEQTPLTHPSSGPQSIMHTTNPRNPGLWSSAACIRAAIHYEYRHEWGASITVAYRVIVNSSGDQKAIYRRILCYDPTVTSYGIFSKKRNPKKDFYRAQRAIQFVLCLDFVNQNPSDVYSTLVIP